MPRSTRFTMFPIFLLSLLMSQPATAQALGNSFSYQGQLSEGGAPALGLYDFQICLFAGPTQPVPLACAPDFNDVPVEDGLFTLALDFGAAVFDGQQRYLELRVRPGASGGYTILSPRQLLRATPEALRAATAPWSGLSGVPAGFADGIDNNSGGTVTSISAGTGLSGGTITASGTLGIADGGVGPDQIAPGSVAAIHIAPGSIGAAQIDPGQVQTRLSAVCPVGEFLRGIEADGSALCEVAPGLPTLSVVDDPPSNNVGEPSLVIGSNGLPVISYWDSTANDLKLALCVDPACRQPPTIRVLDSNGNTGRYNSVAIGSNGLPLISYSGNNQNELRLARCLDAGCVDFDIVTLDSGIGSVFYNALVVPPDGRPVIAYEGGSVLRLLRCSTSDCSGTPDRFIPDNSIGSGSYVAMTLDDLGLPMISYYGAGGSGRLGYIRCTTTDCSSRTLAFVDGPTPDVGTHTSIALDINGRAMISYRDNTNGTLKYARCGNLVCNSGNLVTTVNLGASPNVFNTRIAVGADGSPIIAVVDFPDLRMVRCGNLACTVGNTVSTIFMGTSNGVIPGSPALVLGPDGLPVVALSSFNNGSDLNIWLARCGNRSCQ